MSASAGGTRLIHRLGGVVRRNPIKSAIVFGAAATFGYQRWNGKQAADDDLDDDEYYGIATRPAKESGGTPAKDGQEVVRTRKRKKQVLVIPFHRIRLVERGKKDLQSLIKSRIESMEEEEEDGTSPIEMEVSEFVDLIHTAASDPGIVAMYGIFGHGFGFKAGWAQTEEVRHALRVFRECHRIHREPNMAHDAVLKRTKNYTRKPMYAYADTFSSPLGTAGMKEFYLASVFTHIQLQPQGDLSLFGMHTTNLFLKDFLDKYGIQVHVFKHGLYKNFANQFTEQKYTPHHKENVSNIIHSINEHVWHGIYHGRKKNLSNYDFPSFWKIVQDAGNLTAEVSHQIGFVDYMPAFDPLEQLVASNKSNEMKDEMKKKWGKDTDLDQFEASKMVSITSYQKRQKKKKEATEKKWRMHERIASQSKKSSVLAKALPMAGYNAPHYNIPADEYSEHEKECRDEKIAIYKISGAITDDTARRAETALRKLKKKDDIKCLILRVDSPGGAITACETILQEVKDLPQKVVVSFGNTSASGGYYISSAADRIFASPTTVTGSIGVFMMKLDFRNLISQVGITTDSVTTGSLAGSFDPLYPMNDAMKDNFANFTDRAYLRFKSLVSEGRSLDMDDVETVAQGRVWTGQQAKELGLVDELGGLDRAVAFAQREYTKTKNARIVEWPPTRSTFDYLLEKWNGKEKASSIITSLFSEWILASIGEGKRPAKTVFSLPPTASGMMLTMDENTAIRCLLENSGEYDTSFLDEFPDDFWV
mmetsp:Transcript_22898/g.64877  ORF Transcript_22898/g.64877 Transcript_22898/m.64877 type:complete len:763 (+) Transcript_22898:113-2401(+)|eukprot:CAMPEP_0119560752 /NCGR_PEP_ID=MMETSP1352-20130426/15766_1 /TAXON_ID=265584 /ORGANISM="Stauroneis constricta, Strain CCMP1120" /LENGTH=762 /DNA_ID=CAMNT_0007608801 /DNA_START=65 /DNA_END=2353 /DNA_ORIENTATION=-